MSKYVDMDGMTPEQRTQAILEGLDSDYAELMDNMDSDICGEAEIEKAERDVIQTVNWIIANMDLPTIIGRLQKSNLRFKSGLIALLSD